MTLFAIHVLSNVQAFRTIHILNNYATVWWYSHPCHCISWPCKCNDIREVK